MLPVWSFVKTGSVIQTLHDFWRKFNVSRALSDYIIKMWVLRWLETGSAQDIKCSDQQSWVYSTENIDHTRNAVIWNPQRSVQWQASALSISTDLIKGFYILCDFIHTRCVSSRNWVKQVTNTADILRKLFGTSKSSSRHHWSSINEWWSTLLSLRLCKQARISILAHRKSLEFINIYFIFRKLQYGVPFQFQL